MQSTLQYVKQLKKTLEEDHTIADTIFSLIILFVSLTSFFHVMEYWTLTNKMPFYIITAIATELVIIGSMFGIRYTWVGWLPFILGVFVQGVGNIFYSYININIETDYFKAYVELFKPWFELAYGDELDITNYKRVLAYSNGIFYLSPIVFLWAKMSLKSNYNKLNSNSSTTPTDTLTNDTIDTKSVKIDETPITVEDQNELEVVLDNKTDIVENRESVVEDQPSTEDLPNIVVEDQPIVSEDFPIIVSARTIMLGERPVIIEDESVVIENQPAIIEHELVVVEDQHIAIEEFKETLSFDPVATQARKKKIELQSKTINSNQQELNENKSNTVFDMIIDGNLPVPPENKITTGQMWANTLHEVARKTRLLEDNDANVLKVREYKKTDPILHLRSDFTIAGLKPENK